MVFSKFVAFQIVIAFLFSSLQAQDNYRSTALHSFCQNNFDSTIIYSRYNDWDSYPFPIYYIIAKKDTSTYYFTYKNPYAQMQGRYPAGLSSKFGEENLKYLLTPPDTNRYFLPGNIPHHNKSLFWLKINSFNIWRLEELKDSTHRCYISDDDHDIYYLITSNAVKVLRFYGADLAEACSPKNINRTNELKTRNMILKVFAN